MKFFQKLVLSLLFLTNLYNLNAQLPASNEFSELLLKKTKFEKRTVTAFGRLPVGNELTWVHLQLHGTEAARLLQSFQRPMIKVPHVDGPFGAGWIFKVRVKVSEKQAPVLLRMWNHKVSIECDKTEKISFKCLDSELPDDLAQFVEALVKTPVVGASVTTAKTLDELLDALAISDPQML